MYLTTSKRRSTRSTTWATKSTRLAIQPTGPLAKLRRVLNEAKKAVSKVEDLGKEFDSVKKGFDSFGNEIKNLPDIIKQTAEAAIESWADALLKAVTKEGLKKVRDILKATDNGLQKVDQTRPELASAIDQLSVYVELGPITLTWADFWLRGATIVGQLDKYANSPPSINRDEILRLIEALGPTTINLGLSFNVVALVVGSKELGVGGGIGDVPLVLFTEIADAIMDAAGVPD